MSREKQIDYKEYARQMRENCVKGYNGTEPIVFCSLKLWEEIATIIEGYRKQSENVIELPCKVGTTLYFLYNSPYADKPDLTPRVYKTTDWYFEVDKTGIAINTSDIHSFNKKYDYYLGKTVFLTKQEAEQAIAKMKGGE